jgi:hypothetical protein
MDLIQLRDRVRSKAIQAGLTYSEIETLFDVNELLNQTMPCLMFNYEEESNDYESPFTEVTLRMYLITNLHDSQKIETGEYQRDYLLTAKNALRQKYIDFLTQFQTDESPYIEILRDRQLQLAERVSIEGFLIMEALPIVLVKRNYCLDESEHLPPTIPCDTLINGVVFATTAPVDFGGVYLPSGTLNGRNTYQHKTLADKTIRYDFDAGFGGFLWIAECAISGNIFYSDFPNDAMYPWGFLWQGEDLTSQATVSQACCNGGSTDPATWELRDTDGTVLQSGSIAAGGSAVIVAPDATVENSNQTFQEAIVSNGVEVLNDYEFEFQDSDGNILNTEFRPAMIGETFIVGAGGACPTTFYYDLYINGVFSQTVTIDVTQDINITT